MADYIIYPQRKEKAMADYNTPPTPMPAEIIADKARRIVFDYVKPRLEKTDTHVTFGVDEVYIVWQVKVLQNWKALVSTTLPDGMYYELTYDGDREQTYLDAYKKFENVVVPN
jgi:hypothetical protein